MSPREPDWPERQRLIGTLLLVLAAACVGLAGGAALFG